MPILDLKKIFGALAREGVKYLLVGGMAAIGHGMNYATDDLDICYDREIKNLKAIVKALTPSRPKLRTSSGAVPFIFDEKVLKNGLNFTLQTDWGNIDLLGELLNIGSYKNLLPNAVRYEFYNIDVDTLSLEDLIRAKKIAGRTKDKLHLLELEAILKMKS